MSRTIETLFGRDAKGSTAALIRFGMDIRPIGSRARSLERVGYPTQKPSGTPGPDYQGIVQRVAIWFWTPFAVVQQRVSRQNALDRKWVGIDISEKGCGTSTDPGIRKEIEPASPDFRANPSNRHPDGARILRRTPKLPHSQARSIWEAGRKVQRMPD